jgi:methyl-accepting chemotaxis protein
MPDSTVRVNVVTEGADKAAAELDKVAGATDRVDTSARKAGEGVQTLGDHSGDTSTALSTFAQAASAMGLDGLAAGLDTATVALDAVEGATILWRVATEAGILAQAASKASILLSTAATYAFAFASGVANTAQIIWTATTYALGVAMRFLMGPIGIIITVVALLAAGIIWLWNNNEGFRNAVTAAWNGIKAAIGAVVSWFTSTVIPMFQNLWEKAQGPLDFLRSTAGQVFNSIKAAIDPVVGAFQTLVGWVQSAVDWISKIHIPDLSSLNPFASSATAGVAGPAAVGTIAGIPAVGVYGPAWPAPTVPPLLGTRRGRSAAPAGTVVQVMVPPTANPVETGRQIVNMIRHYESAGSSAWRAG